MDSKNIENAFLKIQNEFDGLYAKLKAVGIDLLLGKGRNIPLHLNERLDDNFFEHLFSAFAELNGTASVDKYRFAVFVWAKYLHERYIQIFSQRVIGLPRYNYWIMSIKWKWHPQMRVFSDEQTEALIQERPESTGYIDTIEWKQRIIRGGRIYYVVPESTKKYTRPAFDAKRQTYVMSRLFTDEPNWQKELMCEYEKKFALIRRAKNHIGEANREFYQATACIAPFISEIRAKSEAVKAALSKKAEAEKENQFGNEKDAAE